MPIFQKTVITKHLKGQNSEIITSKWNVYREHFLNQKVQEDIRSLKEEQYQGEFLEDLFVKILGYTKPASSSETKFNLTTEYKNVKDSKKADGAIIINDVVKAVVELKGTNTTDLAKVETQAFGYKNNQPECTYVITSNFEKLRFYIDNAIEHIEFNLFTLSEEEFNLLYLCLAFENIEKDIPKKIKEESLSEEDAITKKLYKDYSLFRRELHQSLVKLNPQYDALTLFKKTQKLLDRFLFLFFAEDRHLLPPNSVRMILEQWEKLKELDAYTPLFDRFKKYFGYLNTGFKGKQYDVYAYNGGLFKTDEVLDTINIDDDLLFKHTLTLSEYDFNSEVDVNILGHIFENSLSELEEMQAKLEGQEVDKSKSKRKKDGVFYTPKYITKYIVENTVGKLCEEKKVAFKIKEEDYITDKKRQKKTRKTLLDKLTEYRNWLLKITICDPASGSGAFLNQALDFLIEEHRYIDELQAKLFGDAMVLSDVENSILENNLFGVDINEESVEIAKLSLWLRTAQPNRKLNDLSNNIKCGNSLIDDPEVAGDKAFNWQKEFPQIFKKGGFDVVIGNPPYVRAENIVKEHRQYFISNKSRYNKTFGRFDIYIVFNELAIEIIKPNGFLSFIFPSSFFNQNYSSKQRDWFLNDLNLIEIADLSNIDVFKGVAVDTAIVIIKNQLPSESIFCSKPQNEIEFLNGKKSIISKSIFNNLPNKTFRADLNEITVSLVKKIREASNLMEDYCYTVIGAVPHNSKTGASKDRLISYSNNETTNKKYLEGKNVNRYSIIWDGRFINYLPKEMHRPKFPELFENEKLLIRNISTTEGIMATLDSNHYYVNDTMSVSIPWYKLKNINQRGAKGSEIQINLSSQINLKYLLGLINSKLLNYYFKLILSSNLHVYPEAIRNLPIIKNNKQPNIIKAGVELILELKNVLEDISQKFQRTIQRKFELEKLSKKQENWYLLSFGDFVKELNKKKIKLSLGEEAEWEDYFLQEQQKALEFKSKIDTTDTAIDLMVYHLYNLTYEEVKIVDEKIEITKTEYEASKIKNGLEIPNEPIKKLDTPNINDNDKQIEDE